MKETRGLSRWDGVRWSVKRQACQEWDSNPRLQGRLRPERSALDRSAILTAGLSARRFAWLGPGVGAGVLGRHRGARCPAVCGRLGRTGLAGRERANSAHRCGRIPHRARPGTTNRLCWQEPTRRIVLLLLSAAVLASSLAPLLTPTLGCPRSGKPAGRTGSFSGHRAPGQGVG